MRLVVPESAFPIIRCLEHFRDIKDGCFGWDLAPDYRERITSFTQSVRELQGHCQVVLDNFFSYKNCYSLGSSQNQDDNSLEAQHDVCQSRHPADKAR